MHREVLVAAMLLVAYANLGRGELMRLRARDAEDIELRGVGVAERLAPYEIALSDPRIEPVDNELVERAVTLLKVMPLGQSRETIESLLSPNDRLRGRRAVDTLISAELAFVDDHGRLRGIA